MTISYTTNKNLAKPAYNTEVDQWDQPLNSNSNIIDNCLGSVTTISITGTSTLTLSTSQYQATTIYVTGTLNSGNVIVKLPNGVSGQFTFINGTVQTDATSTLLIGWTSGGNTISISQNSTKILTGDGAVPAWYQAAPEFSGISTAIASISLTSLSTYTLTAVDTASRVIKFTGTLANSTVTVKLPITIGGQWTVVNATTAAGSSSLLQLQWTSGGNTYNVNQSSTQILYADPSGPTWSSAAPQALTGITTINLTGASSTITITDAQARNPYFYITGTQPSSYNVNLLFPDSASGLYVFNSSFSASANLVLLGWSSGGSGAALTTSTKQLIWGGRNPASLTSGLWSALTL